MSFIDNVIISTEEEKEHDKIVEEVVKRLAENNLYVKPEKCKWKVKEVGFLDTEISKIGKLLLLIYQRFCSNSQTITQYGKERSKVGMNRKAEEDV